MNKFTKQEDEILAESVSRYPPLYDPQNKNHKDLNIKEAIWVSVVEIESCQDENFSHSQTKKIIDPDHPMMTSFQNALNQHLLKQKDNLKQELFDIEKKIASKKNYKVSMENKKNVITNRLKAQYDTLMKFHSTKANLEMIRKKFEASINQRKQEYNEITTKTSNEMEKISILKRKLSYSQSLLKDLTTYEDEQTISLKKFDSKKSKINQLKKIYLNNQQQKNLLCSSLTQEIGRLEDRKRQLKQEAETKYNESELLKQKLMNSSTDMDIIIKDNAKLTLLWNTVLTNIELRNDNIQRMKIDFQEAKDKHHTLLVEANSYKRSDQKESTRNKNLRNSSNELKLKHSHLKNTYDTLLDKFNSSNDEYSTLIQMTNFEQLNLDQVLLEQKTLNNEIQILINLLDEKSNLKLKYEEDVLNELKKLLLTNNKSNQNNNKISELRIQIKDHELMLVESEKKFRQALLQLEQYREISSTLKNDIEKNTKCLNDQEFILSTLHSELKKLNFDIHNKSNSIFSEEKKLRTTEKKEEENFMEIDQVQYKIEKAQKETELMNKSWVQNQNLNVQLMNTRNKQYNELKKVHKIAIVLDTKNKNLNSEIISLTKQVVQHERTLDNMRRNLVKLNENYYKKEGKSSQLLNENEWLQHCYIAELEENEKQSLEYVHQLKLVKNELNEIKTVCAEKQRESLSWETKVQTLVEIKNEIKFKDGDLGDIEDKKKEIHRMQIREKQLIKDSKKIMKDLELSLLTHTSIYNKALSKVDNSKEKKNSKQSLLKKLENLRIVIEKKKKECEKLKTCVNKLQHGKIELECKLTSLNGKITNVEKDISDLTATIEDLGITKIKNVYELSYKQSYAKHLDEVNNDKYRMVIKNESKMNDELEASLKMNSNLISVVENLKNDFPNLSVQITRMLFILKSTGSS